MSALRHCFAHRSLAPLSVSVAWLAMATSRVRTVYMNFTAERCNRILGSLGLFIEYCAVSGFINVHLKSDVSAELAHFC